MSWWQAMCVEVAITFFRSLIDAKPGIKEAVKPKVKQVFDIIRQVFPDDPDFQ
jgi:hypothetical protein